jgi:hypothetical protein
VTRNPIARTARSLRPQVVPDRRRREADEAAKAEIADTIIRAIIEGPLPMLRQFESSQGFTLVKPGDVPWLPASDWPEDIVVSLDGKRVRIVAIQTETPGCGAFSSLVTDIIRAGLIPTVIAPMGAMAAILTRWGRHHRIVGMSFAERREVWWPTRKWREARIA